MSSTAVDIRGIRQRSFGGLHLLLLIGLTLGGVVVLVSVLSRGVARNDLEIFLALLLFYGVATVAFLVSQIRSGHFPFFDLPVFLTIAGFVRFGLLPLATYLNPDLLNPYFYSRDYPQLNRTFFFFVLGMLAFWAGCRLCRQKAPESAAGEPISGETKSEVVFGWAIALFIISEATRLYITRTYGWGYGMSLEVYFANLAVFQVFQTIAGLGTFALAIMTIEMCFHPRSSIRKALFAIFLLTEAFWGALSGMKQDLLRNFVLVAVIVSISKAKFDKKWIAGVLLGFVLIYPIQNHYRSIVSTGDVDARQIGALGHAGNTAAQEAAQEQPGWLGWVESGWAMTLGRLDMLQPMAITVSLDPWQVSRVQGEERWWMVPFYPFIPRFIWPSKPTLVRGQRLSMLLGAGSHTSTALTYPGDLYMDWGLSGLMVGMFALGLFAQWITNFTVGHPRKRDLFFYSTFFLIAANLYEADWFLVWVSLLRWLVWITILAYLIYGFNRTRRENQPAAAQGTAAAADPPGPTAASPPRTSHPWHRLPSMD